MMFRIFAVLWAYVYIVSASPLNGPATESLSTLFIYTTALTGTQEIPSTETIYFITESGTREACAGICDAPIEFVTETFTVATTVLSASVTTITTSGSTCPSGASCSTLISTSYVPITTSTAIPVSVCVYNLTSDMYGLGVRLGFYLQAISNFLSAALLNHGVVDLGRDTSASLAFGILVAFLLGITESSLALEAQVFVALISIVCLPLLIQPILNWSWTESIASQGSLFVLYIIYIITMSTSVWGVLHGWIRTAQCDVLSGLSGRSALSPSARMTWLVFFCMGLAFGCGLFAAVLFKKWWARHDLNKSEKKSEKNDANEPKIPWIHQDPKTFIPWAIFYILLFIVCVTSVELTIKWHHIDSPGLSESEYGQWIAFSVGLFAVVSVFWEWMWQLRDNSKSGRLRRLWLNRRIVA